MIFNAFIQYITINPLHVTGHYISRKHQNSSGFFMFSGVIERDQWYEIDQCVSFIYFCECVFRILSLLERQSFSRDWIWWIFCSSFHFSSFKWALMFLRKWITNFCDSNFVVVMDCSNSSFSSFAPHSKNMVLKSKFLYYLNISYARHVLS